MGPKHCHSICTWWRHQMETLSALLAICAGNSPVTGKFPTQRPVTRSFDAFFDLRLNKRLSKQSWGWWFETLPRPFWRHSNDLHQTICKCPSTKHRAAFTNDNFAQCFWSDDALNSFSHGEVYMWNASALVQAMTCCLFGTKRVPKQKETYSQLDHQEQTSMKLPSKNENLHWRKCISQFWLQHFGHLD